jgi:methanogenic corrinoid protein MtbC1
VAVALGLLDSGFTAYEVISDLLVPAQRRVGDLWVANELSVADEHLVTASSEASLHALAMANTSLATSVDVVLACAEGDWHSIGAHMLAVQLETGGVGVRFLGASTPATHVAKLLTRDPPDALVVSCTMPIYFSGVTRLADAAHAIGVPVLAGGAALDDDGPQRARLLGADAWAANVAEAVAILKRWRARPPAASHEPTHLPEYALALEQQALQLGTIALNDRTQRTPASGDDRVPSQLTHDDVTLILRFMAASHLVQSDTVFTDFLGWLGPHLLARGLPAGSLTAALESLGTQLPALAPADIELLRLGAGLTDRW